MVWLDSREMNGIVVPYYSLVWALLLLRDTIQGKLHHQRKRDQVLSHGRIFRLGGGDAMGILGILAPFLQCNTGK